MYYVYSKHLKAGREDMCKICNNAEDAIHHIAKCYKIDTQLGQLGEYYYFMIKR